MNKIGNSTCTPILANIVCSDENIKIEKLWMKVEQLNWSPLGYSHGYHWNMNMFGEAEVVIKGTHKEIMEKVFSINIEIEDKNIKNITLQDCMIINLTNAYFVDNISSTKIEFIFKATSPAIFTCFEQLFVQCEVRKDGCNPNPEDKPPTCGYQPTPKEGSNPVSPPKNIPINHTNTMNEDKSLSRYLKLWMVLYFDDLDDPIRSTLEHELSKMYHDLYSEDERLELDKIVKMIISIKMRSTLKCEKCVETTMKSVTYEDVVKPFVSTFSGVTHDWFRLVDGKCKMKTGVVEIVNKERNCYIVRFDDSHFDLDKTNDWCVENDTRIIYESHAEVIHGEDISEKDLPLQIGDKVFVLEGLVDHIFNGGLSGQRSRIFMVEVQHKDFNNEKE